MGSRFEGNDGTDKDREPHKELIPFSKRMKMQSKNSCIYYIRYVDHVLFRNTHHRLYHPCIRETCGWIVDETPEAVWVLWDQGVERLPYERVQVRESGWSS